LYGWLWVVFSFSSNLENREAEMPLAFKWIWLSTALLPAAVKASDYPNVEMAAVVGLGPASLGAAGALRSATD